ncbi:phage protein Gp36 family protein [Flavobacterium beibuense]|uniref:phage protein Gp36 family protein n=1 Tax=Flavobacterium beibuense TaxID=657326 RepID=UPI003A91484D
MVYIVKNDLVTFAHERLINESCETETTLDEIEIIQIGIVKSYLGTRYNVNQIFSEPIKNDVLVSIIARMTLYRLFKRNATRKVPSDAKDDYEAAMKELTDISTGKIKLSDLPVAIDGQGNPVSNSIWGNNRNPNFYI